jgi:predicted RNase H-related nuclease YkuK (DUF458 family)
MNRQFVKHDGTKILDVLGYMKDYMGDTNGQIKYEIFVGCDSQVNSKNTIYSVVIGIHRIVDGLGRGVHIIHTRERDKKVGEDRGGIFKRLWNEVERIVETALFLSDNGIRIDDIGTHVDANVKKQYASNMIYDSAIGWLNSLKVECYDCKGSGYLVGNIKCSRCDGTGSVGFKVEGKPYAWAATYAANRYCR